MYRYSVELLALFITLLILVFTCRAGMKLSYMRKWFVSGIIINIISIILDLVTLSTIDNPELYPIPVDYLLNTLYYAACFCMIFIYVAYLIRKMLFHVMENNPSSAIIKGLGVLLAVQVILLIVNLSTGVIFRYTEDLVYTRGPLWVIGYIQLLISIGAIVFCTLKYSIYIDHEGKRLCSIGVPIIMVCFVYQMVYPNVLLNGTMGAFTAMICYLSFEAHSEDADSICKRGNLTAFMNDIKVFHRSSTPYQVMLVSFRHYAALNTTIGFLAGNETLYRMGNFLEQTFPKGNVYRFAPVTFAVLLPFKDKENAKSEYRRLIDSLPAFVKLNKMQYRIKPYYVNLINTDYSLQASRIIEMLECAKEYAKQNYVQALDFDIHMQQQFRRRRYLIDYLQKSIDDERFQMWYQPIYCTASGKYCSAEALLRLADEEGKMISPEEFVPIAEEMGLIAQISREAASSMIDFLSSHPELPVKQISLNLAMQQLQTEDYMENFFRLMDEKGVPREKIAYEITERMLITNDEQVKQTLENMRQADCQFLLDDFGTGYSNFTMVLDYPCSKIKLDKSFLWKDTSDNYRMVSMLIRLFHEFGKQVVVEGVETAEQAEKLIELGADYLQGFYYSRPLPEKEYAAFMENHL